MFFSLHVTSECYRTFWLRRTSRLSIPCQLISRLVRCVCIIIIMKEIWMYFRQILFVNLTQNVVPVSQACSTWRCYFRKLTLTGSFWVPCSFLEASSHVLMQLTKNLEAWSSSFLIQNEWMNEWMKGGVKNIQKGHRGLFRGSDMSWLARDCPTPKMRGDFHVYVQDHAFQPLVLFRHQMEAKICFCQHRIIWFLWQDLYCEMDIKGQRRNIPDVAKHHIHCEWYATGHKKQTEKVVCRI